MKEAKKCDFYEILKNFSINVQEENIKILKEEIHNQRSSKYLNTYYSQKKLKSTNLFIIARNKSRKKLKEESFKRDNSINKINITSVLTNEKKANDLLSRFDELQKRQRKELKDFRKAKNHIRKTLKITPLLFADLKLTEPDSKINLFNSSCKKYLFIKNDEGEHSLNKNRSKLNTIYPKQNFNFNFKLEKTKNEFPILFSYNYNNNTTKNICKIKRKIKYYILKSPNKLNKCKFDLKTKN